MSSLQAFLEYAQAFEAAHMTDDWSLIEPYFALDAQHTVVEAGPLTANNQGRTAVVAGLRDAVHTLDRRFDLRIPEVLAGPITRDDGIWMRFGLTLCRTGLPDLSIEGEHLTSYENGTIARIDEHLLGTGGADVAAYLEQHGAALKPVAAPPDLSEAGHRMQDLHEAIMRTIVRCYGQAKSEQDIGAALTACHDAFTIETVSFKIASADRDDTAAQLALFFDAFPDYSVTLDGLTTDGAHVCAWGTARMTLAGTGLGIEPTGKTATLPIFCVFGFRDGLLASERFFFDLATLCQGIGIPIEALTEVLEGVRERAA
jgi:predicted ester cyclase